jgi:hypothetical protein
LDEGLRISGVSLRLRFWFWFLAQSVAVGFILWNGIPVYRRLLIGTRTSGTDVAFIAIAGVLVIQLGYWRSFRLRDHLHFERNTVLSHLLLFLARLNFIYVGGMFSTVFFIQFSNIELNLWKIVALIAVLFSMFCFSLQLEWLGQAFFMGSGSMRSAA